MYNTQCEYTALRFLVELIRCAPFRIKKVQTDNGSEFTSKYMNNHGSEYQTPFEMYLQAAGIKYYHIQPGKPWQNGRVECQHRLDKERFYNRLAIMSLEQGNANLEAYNRESNHYVRLCLGGKSAMEKIGKNREIQSK